VVPFVDLSASHSGLKVEILADIATLMESGSFVNGPDVAAFESAFAAYCGTRECVGVSSGWMPSDSPFSRRRYKTETRSCYRRTRSPRRSRRSFK
jgi:hypothetical protein